MANYTATRIKSATTTANTADQITLGKGYPYIEVVNRDTALDLWVTIDSGDTNQTTLTPTVAGDECLYVGPGGVRICQDDNTLPINSSQTAIPASIVRVISSGACAYTITGHAKLPN